VADNLDMGDEWGGSSQEIVSYRDISAMVAFGVHCGEVW